MNCASYAALLDGYIDGILSSKELKMVENHLKTCPECAAYVSDILAIDATFPTEEDIALPPNFTQSVMAQVAKHPRKPKKTTQWQRFALPAVACLAVVIYAGGHLDLPNLSLGGADSSSMSMSTATVSYSATPETAVAMDESMMETTTGTTTARDMEVEVDDMDTTTESVDTLYFPQDAVGTFLDAYPATVLDDGSFSYELSPDDFAAFMAQVAPDTTTWPEQELFWVVIMAN